MSTQAELWENTLAQYGLDKPDELSREQYAWLGAGRQRGGTKSESYLRHLGGIPSSQCFNQGLAVVVIVMSQEALAKITHHPVRLGPMEHAFAMGATDQWSKEDRAAHCKAIGHLGGGAPGHSRTSKTYEFTNPAGVRQSIHNLKDFCRNNNLSYSSMKRVIRGVYRQHKGWRYITFPHRPILLGCKTRSRLSF
jgi:hypothetical protein